MKFILATAALFTAVLGSPLLSLSARDVGIDVYDGPNQTGGHATLDTVDGQCNELSPDWVDAISSVEIPAGWKCAFYAEYGCTGYSLTMPALSVAKKYNFADDGMDKMSVGYLCTEPEQ